MFPEQIEWAVPQTTKDKCTTSFPVPADDDRGGRNFLRSITLNSN
jgi:hypothetical protein